MKILSNVSLKERSPLQLTGTTKYWVDITSEKDLYSIWEWIQKNQIKYFILGEGSNTVVVNNWDGIILHPKGCRLEIKVNDKIFYYTLPSQNLFQEFYSFKQDKNLIEFIQKNPSKQIECKVESGVHWDSFIYFCLLHGIRGLEPLSGIPGKVGAVPIQNVGAYGEEVKNFIFLVEAYDLRTLEKKIFTREECEFQYRDSFFKKHINQYLISSVHFLFSNLKKEIQYEELKKYYYEKLSNPQELEAIKKMIPQGHKVLEESILSSFLLRYSVYQIRREKGMILEANHELSKNLGSFFLNPLLSEKEFLNLQKKIISKNRNLKIPFFKEDHVYKIPAAWLIEFAGFYKGYEEKGFMISPKHNLCIINKNGDLESLKEFVKKIQDTVYKKTQILLKPEPIFMEEFQ